MMPNSRNSFGSFLRTSHRHPFAWTFELFYAQNLKGKQFFGDFRSVFSAFHHRCDTKLKVNYFRESGNHEKRREKMLLNNVSLKGFPFISKFNRLPCYLLSRFSSHGRVCQFCDKWKIRKMFFSANKFMNCTTKCGKRSRKLFKRQHRHSATPTKQILMKTLRFPSALFFSQSS